MRLHASCAAYDGAGVLLVGPSGCGKSDLLLRLIDAGFSLVADDQVEVTDGRARPPASLAGLIEVRGLGIFRLDHTPDVPVRLVVALCEAPDARLPWPARDPRLDTPRVRIDAWSASAPARVRIALACACGRTSSPVGAFAA